MKPRLTPYSSLNDSRRRLRISTTLLMSSSLKVVSIAAVCCASTSRSAMVRRRRDMRTRSSRSATMRVLAALGVGAAARWLGDVAAEAVRSGCSGPLVCVAPSASSRRIKPSMSCLVTRPSAPLGGTFDRSTWCSAANRRATGVALLWSSSTCSSITPSTSPILTSSPSRCVIRLSTPLP